MPFLFSLGQHAALHTVQGRFEAGERLFAFLDDIIAPNRVGPVYTAIVRLCGNIPALHVGKTKVWNSGGMRPVACDMLERIARENNPDNCEVMVWRGGGPNRTNSFGPSRLILLSDLQSVWALLLHCASGRANYQ